MPRKPRITAIPVDQVQPVLTLPASDQREEGLVVASNEKTDAEQMTEILQEVQQEPKEEPKDAVSDAPGEVKPKAKRASRAKPKEEPRKEEPLEVEPIEEQILKSPEPKEEARIDDKVACPDCGKQMSAKTLKYSHVANCVTKKQKQKPVFTQGSQDQREENTQPAIQREIEVDFIEQRALNRRAERVARWEAMVNRLMQHVF